MVYFIKTKQCETSFMFFFPPLISLHYPVLIIVIVKTALFRWKSGNNVSLANCDFIIFHGILIFNIKWISDYRLIRNGLICQSFIPFDCFNSSAFSSMNNIHIHQLILVSIISLSRSNLLIIIIKGFLPMPVLQLVTKFPFSISSFGNYPNNQKVY
jgi:hypothetical protein